LDLIKIKFGKDRSFWKLLPYTILFFVFVIKLVSLNLSLDLYVAGDSVSYILTLQEIKSYFFSHHRTMALPIIYNIFEVTGISLKVWPYSQFFITIYAIHILSKTITNKIPREIESILITIFYILILQIDYRSFISDSLSFSLLIFSFAFAIRLFEKVSTKNILIFTLCVFLTWYVRPAFITIVPTIICIFFLRFLFFRGKIKSLIIIFFTIVPLISFLGIRHHYTGQIGIVPFGGFAISTHSGYYLNSNIIKKLQPENQILANKILSRYNDIKNDKNYISNRSIASYNCFDTEKHSSLGIKTSSIKKLDCLNYYGITFWISTILHMNETSGLDPSASKLISMDKKSFGLLKTNLADIWPKDNVRYDLRMTNLGIDIMKNHIKEHFIFFLYGNYKSIKNFFNSFLFLSIVAASFVLLPLIKSKYDNKETIIYIKNIFNFSSFFLLFSIINIAFVNVMIGPIQIRYMVFSTIGSIPFIIIFIYFIVILYRDYALKKINKFENK